MGQQRESDIGFSVIGHSADNKETLNTDTPVMQRTSFERLPKLRPRDTQRGHDHVKSRVGRRLCPQKTPYLPVDSPDMLSEQGLNKPFQTGGKKYAKCTGTSVALSV